MRSIPMRSIPMRSIPMRSLASFWLIGFVCVAGKTLSAQQGDIPPTQRKTVVVKPDLDEAKIKQLIVDLDSNDFTVRDSAFKTLSQGAIRKPKLLIDVTLDSSSSFEAKNRCLKILQSWSSTANDVDQDAIRQAIKSYDAKKYAESREFKLLREYFLLDMSSNPKLILEKLKAGGIKVENGNGKMVVYAHEWNRPARELAYLKKIQQPFRLTTSPKFMEMAVDHLADANISEIYIGRKPTVDRGFRRPFPVGEEAINDRVMSQIQKMKKLKKLEFAFVQVSDKGYKGLAQCRQLEHLKLAKGINDENLSFVQSLSNLKTLEFHNAFDMKGPGLKYISKLEKLEKIEIFFTGIEGKYLKHLTELPNLTRLYAPQTQMNDEGMEHISKITSLKELVLDNTHATNAGLEKINKLPNLSSIDLISGSFSNSGVMKLTSLPNLRSVRVGGGMITKDILNDLKKAGAKFKVSGQYFKPNSKKEYQAIEKLLAAGLQINQYARPDNLTVMVYPGSWKRPAETLKEMKHLKAIKHLRFYVYGSLTKSDVDALLELDPSFEIRLFPDRDDNQNVVPAELVDRLKEHFPKFSQ